MAEYFPIPPRLAAVESAVGASPTTSELSWPRWCKVGGKIARTRRKNHATRTRWNVRDSDLTLVLTKGEPTEGTLLTVQAAKRQGRPCVVVDLAHDGQLNAEAERVRGLLAGVKVLNVAGPRESGKPGVYGKA